MGKKNVNGQMRDVEAEADQGVSEPVQPASDEAPAAAKASVAAETMAAAPAPATPADPVEQLTQELQRTKDQLLRQAAEFQNYRRRTEKERAEWGRRAQIPVIESMLTVLDDFRRSLDASEQVEQQETPGPAYQALKEGVELVYKNFAGALEKLGVEYIEAVGQPFDENLHEALMQMPASDDAASGIIVQEIQRGYRLGDRVLRHSKVIVAA